MPIYGYKCDCGWEFDKIIWNSQKPEEYEPCESCGAPAKKDEINPVSRPVIH